MAEAPAGRAPERGARSTYLAAGALILLAPLASFLAHAGYPLYATGALQLVLATAALGAAAGVAMGWGGNLVRVAVATALVTLAVDLQTPWITDLGLRKAAVFVAALAAFFWLVRDRLGAILAVVFGTMCLGTFTVPAVAAWRVEGAAEEGRADLAPVVHVLLDGHIGIEGIPAEFDPDRSVATAVRDGLTQRGFTVFTRAYSRYYNTSQAIPAVLNLDAPGKVDAFIVPGGREPFELQANALARLLAERGYRLHVVETDFLDLCHAGGERIADVCATYPLETIQSVRDLPLGAWTKAGLIFGSYRRLSELDTRVRTRLKAGGARRVSAVSTMHAVEPIVELLGKARPGEAWLVHLMLPHYPHVYDAECALKPDPATWLDGPDAAAQPRNNTAESRRARYPGYLEQLRCTQRLIGRMLDALAEAGVADRATIVLHGDHGSRLDTGPPVLELARAMGPADYLDAFSTLFAVKLPGARTGAVDRRPLPVERLVGAALRDGALPGPEGDDAPSVWINVGNPELESHALPPFANGLPTDAW